MLRREREYYVYIMANYSRTIYTGVTNNLLRRILEHKTSHNPESFTTRSRIDKLVYYEAGNSIVGAIEREKVIKGWIRRKKIALIESMNPSWKDLWDEIQSG